MVKKNIFYLRILIDSWKLVWRNKLLWFFGLFSFILGKGVWCNFTSDSFSGVFKQGGIIFNLAKIGIFNNSFLNNLKNAMLSDWFSFFMIIFIFLLIIFIFIILIFVSAIGQGGLVYSIFKLDKKEKINIHDGISIGRRNFWRILSLNIIEKYIIWTLSFFLATLTVLGLAKKSSSIIIWSFIFLILITVVLIICSLIMKYALAFVVLKGKNPIASIKEGIILFYKNYIVNFEIAFFLFVINYIFKYIMILMAIILLVPLTRTFEGFSLYMFGGFSFDFYFVFIPCLLIFFVLSFISILVSYNYSVWTLMFVRLNNNKRINKGAISNLIGNFKKSRL
ncbi:MAG: hypothetical protein GWO87_00170 [Xanthomonadaceae bacterium]|nr:hypothetical protein [Rhodospirillaceae bacterium]NIA17595.1 hypothetical protein [Xanthomonadaceae bacterium]